jgi:hypothetical protein
MDANTTSSSSSSSSHDSENESGSSYDSDSFEEYRAWYERTYPEAANEQREATRKEVERQDLAWYDNQAKVQTQLFQFGYLPDVKERFKCTYVKTFPHLCKEECSNECDNARNTILTHVELFTEHDAPTIKEMEITIQFIDVETQEFRKFHSEWNKLFGATPQAKKSTTLSYSAQNYNEMIQDYWFASQIIDLQDLWAKISTFTFVAHLPQFQIWNEAEIPVKEAHHRWILCQLAMRLV